MKYHSEGAKGIAFANKETNMCHRLFFFVVLLSLIPSQASSWDDKKTHPILTKQAVKNATDFEDVLNMQLGFEDADIKLSNGLETLSITDWLRKDSLKEDDPLCRAANHFHNPWKPWDESKMTDSIWILDKLCGAFTSFGAKYSNISWATGFRKTIESDPIDYY
jgi:hypothetical protein